MKSFKTLAAYAVVAYLAYNFAMGISAVHLTVDGSLALAGLILAWFILLERAE